MTERKTKYDDHLIYNPKTNKLAHFTYDCSWGNVAEWFVYDGTKPFWIKGKKRFPKGFIEVARFPEGTIR